MIDFVFYFILPWRRLIWVWLQLLSCTDILGIIQLQKLCNLIEPQEFILKPSLTLNFLHFLTGKGVIAEKDFEKGDFLLEYAGELSFHSEKVFAIKQK